MRRLWCRLKIRSHLPVFVIWYLVFYTCSHPHVCSGPTRHDLHQLTLRTYQCDRWGDAIRLSHQEFPYLLLNKGEQAPWVGWWCVARGSQRSFFFFFFFEGGGVTIRISICMQSPWYGITEGFFCEELKKKEIIWTNEIYLISKQKEIQSRHLPLVKHHLCLSPPSILMAAKSSHFLLFFWNLNVMKFIESKIQYMLQGQRAVRD